MNSTTTFRRRNGTWILGGLLWFASPAWPVASSPVVVELFESQGCSSCPPAERIMALLHRQFGSSVLLLSFHVDYWDSLGWKDPFSDRAWTDRQKDYAGVFGRNSMYTPEMVVDGEVGFVGSDARQAVGQVEGRLNAKRLVFSLKLFRARAGARLVIDLPGELARAAGPVSAVVLEDAAPVKVLRGENAGATMSGDDAVRALTSMTLDASGHGEATLALHPGWDPSHLSVAILVRGKTSRFLAAQSAPWPAQ